MRIALCQINPTVADLDGNVERILGWAQCAADDGADLAVFPELCVTGYPPLDLLDSPGFIADVQAALDRLAADLPPELGVIVGAPVPNTDHTGKRLYNAALLFDGGAIVAQVNKTLLPTYDVFDEYRYFEPAPRRRVVNWRGKKLGLHICEDMWNNEEHAAYHLYDENPIDELAAQGAELFVNISASPFSMTKQATRRQILVDACREHGLPFVFVNQVGANTEIIFDGDSRVLDANGAPLVTLASFEEGYAVWEWTSAAENGTTSPRQNGHTAEQPHSEASIADLHDALVLGIRDYFAKTPVFAKTLIGLSGGIDSAVTCALAANALGPERVVGITMPSAYSSTGSVSDSQALADALGIEFHEVSIRPAVDAFGTMLTDVFAGTEENVAEENVQARARGLTLMAVSNKFNYLLLTTGNKSEMAVGYATLYGDMSGGLAVLSDVFKQEVYALARHINDRAGREIIPENTITKPPSAELKPGQQDSDSLPPYDVLDHILRCYIEDHLPLDTIVAQTGYNAALVGRILRMVDRNEYKRRQAAPGLRVTTKAFGLGRRMPIVMKRTHTTAAVDASV
ncbi:MAG: NAD+ synthase [Bacteroidota bacterium]